jgi:hypothetical protein
MMSDILYSTLATLVASGPAEWAIHKYMLHGKARHIGFIRDAAISHNDNHHGAYLAPAHYYRDLTNEHVLVHFAPHNVVQIAAGGALFGTGLSMISPIELAGGVIGGTLGTMMTYGLYEFTHHYMHVIGERRLAIGRAFGDIVEKGDRSGNLRLPKPTLDSLCTVIDDKLDGRETPFLYEKNCQEVLASQGNNLDISTLMDRTYRAVREWESEFLESATTEQKKNYDRERKVHRFLRHSALFERLDNHHFVHHKSYGSNLNIVWMWWDNLIGTKKDSSVSELLANKKYWLCPNSPDTEKFVLKNA